MQRKLSVFKTLILAAACLAAFIPARHVHAESKKGLQVQMADDALALGVRHAAINVNLVQLGAPSGKNDGDVLFLDDKRYEFNRGYVKSLASSIEPLRSQGLTVYLIILAYHTTDPELKRAFIHPNYNIACPFHISAFNTGNTEGERLFRACITYLGQRFSSADGPPLHYIVGNEVNSHWYWHNMGETTMDTVVTEYERAVRACHSAARSVSPRSRVYLSLDHFWNLSMDPKEPKKYFGGRALVEAFAALARKRGDFEWHIAHHPYPENLFDCRFWNDKTATMNANTPRITFKNIELLAEIMKQPELTYNGCPRRIILSEQGFHSTDKPNGELLQAAAYAYAYHKVDRIEGIDAFILHRHVDHSQEGGLHLGLWTGNNHNQPVKKKLIYEVFRAAGTPEWEQAFKFALPVIGIKDWSEAK